MLIKIGLLALMVFLSYAGCDTSKDKEGITICHIATIIVSILLSIVLIFSNTNILYSLVQICGVLMLLVAFNPVILFKEEKPILVSYSLVFVLVFACLMCSFPFSTFPIN